METKTQTNAGQGFGIAALVLGILAIITAPIPCIGVLALVPGILGIIFAVVALVQAGQNNGAKALIIVALVLSSLGTAVSTLWVMAFSAPAMMTNTLFRNFRNVFDLNDFVKGFDDLDKKIDHEIDKNMDNGTYTITIKKTYSSTQDSLVKKLEELEGNSDSLTIKVKTIKKDTVIRK